MKDKMIKVPEAMREKGYTGKTGLAFACLTLFFMGISAYFFGCSPIGDGYLFHQAGWGKLTYLAGCFLLAAAAAALVCRLYGRNFEKISRLFLREKALHFRRRFHITKKELWLLALLVLIGGLLRIIGYNWGVTSIFQPDESNLVRPVLMMAMDKWPYYDYFGYPNMFVSRLAWLCIIVYGELTGTAVSITMIEGYFIFRIIVALFSTATIVVVYLIGNYIDEHLGLLAAALTAFFPEYVCLAKQVSGDSTALFFLTCLLLVSLLYQERKTCFPIFCMSMFAAMATAEKWHGAVGCFYIAAVIIAGSREIRTFLKHGVCAFLSYVGVLCLIAPSLFWNLKGAVGGVLYMYQFDKEDKVYTWGELFTGRIADFLAYAGILTLALLLVGIGALWKTRNRSHMVLLLGILKLLAVSFLNRGFPRWALEFYLTLLVLIAMGMREVLYHKSKTVVWAGRVAAELTVCSFLAGAVLNTVTASESIRDTRLLQDAYCDANGITKENSMYEYYTGFRPGGINPGKEDGLSTEYHKLTDMLQADGTGRLYKTQDGIDYAIDLLGSYDTEATALLAQQCPVVQTFDSVGPDICYRPVTGVRKSWHEPGIIWQNYKQIEAILRGGSTGGSIVIYDVSMLPVKQGENTYQE